MKLSIPLFIASIFHHVHAVSVFDVDGTQVFSTGEFDWSIKPGYDVAESPSGYFIDIDWDFFEEKKMLKSTMAATKSGVVMPAGSVCAGTLKSHQFDYYYLLGYTCDENDPNQKFDFENGKFIQVINGVDHCLARSSYGGRNLRFIPCNYNDSNPSGAYIWQYAVTNYWSSNPIYFPTFTIGDCSEDKACPADKFCSHENAIGGMCTECPSNDLCSDLSLSNSLGVDNCQAVCEPLPPLGRFEIRHQKTLGSALIESDELKASVNVDVGSSIDSKFLSIEVYGMMGSSITDVSECKDGEEITTITNEKKQIENGAGSYGFDLDLANVASSEMATDGATVDICSRFIYNDETTGVMTFRDTRFTILRTYTAGLTDIVTIEDPKADKVDAKDEETVKVEPYFCNTDKKALSSNLEFTQGQDIRICVKPEQPTNSDFEYKVTEFKDVACVSDSGSHPVDDPAAGTMYAVDGQASDDGTLGFTFLLSETYLEKFGQTRPSTLDCDGTVTLSYSRKTPTIARRELKVVASFGNNDVGRLLQEDAGEAPFDINVNISQDGSSASTEAGHSLAAFGAAAASAVAVLL